MADVVIVAAKRTAVGNFGGTLKDISAVDLGAATIRDALTDAGLRPVVGDALRAMAPDTIADNGPTDLEARYGGYADTLTPVQVDEVIMGNVVGAGLGQNPARQAMIRAGVAKEGAAFTVNKVCGSGMKAVVLGAQAIMSGQAEVVIAGGMENMSQIPYTVPAMRWGGRMGDSTMVDLLVFDGLYEIFYGYHMGITAENIAERYGIGREEQDALGAESHRRALTAIEAGWFADETTPVTVPQRKGDPVVFATDERPMATSEEKMARLRPAFKKDGTVTAGNASGINDAAAALVLMRADRAKDLGATPLARIRGMASAGLDPAFMGLGPIPAVRRLMAATGTSIGDFGLVELNEAFAVQAMACVRELGLDPSITNVVGSGISIGHPIGCTGARIITTLLHQMIRRDVSLGLAGLCIGGGQGMAVAIERV